MAARWARELGYRRAFILHDGDTYLRTIADVVRAEAGKIGLVVAGYELATPNLTDYREVAQRIAASADLVYYVGMPDRGAAPLFRDIKGERPAMRIMTMEAMGNATFLDRAGSAAEGMYFTRLVLPPLAWSAKAKGWAESYRSRFCSDADAFALYGYEAAKVVIDAIRRAGTSATGRTVVRDTIMGTRAFEGVLGRAWSFSAEGDTSFTMLWGLVVEKGELKFVKAPE